MFFCVFVVFGLMSVGDIGRVNGDSLLVIVDFKGGIIFGFYFLI